MDIKYKLYPYPVLISNTDDYVNSSFQFTVNIQKGIREISFEFNMSLSNGEMVQLITEEKAVYLVHIECPQTCFREIIRIDQAHFTKHIPEKYLNGKISICAFVVAAKDLENFKNDDFNPDYAGISFFVDEGSILAIGGQFNVNVIKETEELAKIPSIFTICKYASDIDTDERMKIDIDSDKIVIALSNESFQNYKILVNTPDFLPVTHAMIILPALIFVFETLKREGLEEYEDRRWLTAIKKTLLKSEIILSEDVLNDLASYDLAQKLLDLPIDRALRALTTYDDSEEE